MARREPKNTRQDARSKSSSSSVSSEEDSDSASSTSPNNPNQLPKGNGALDMEPEYHTEDSDASTSDDNEEEESSQTAATPTLNPPFLPQELLKNLPSPTHSLSNVLDIPWNEMTRDQKRIERHRSRRSKKRSWDMFPPVPAEVKALRRRRAGRQRLEMGRKGKGVEKRRAQVSGRQRMLVERRRVVERGGVEAAGTVKKVKPKR